MRRQRLRAAPQLSGFPADRQRCSPLLEGRTAGVHGRRSEKTSAHFTSVCWLQVGCGDATRIQSGRMIRPLGNEAVTREMIWRRMARKRAHRPLLTSSGVAENRHDATLKKLFCTFWRRFHKGETVCRHMQKRQERAIQLKATRIIKNRTWLSKLIQTRSTSLLRKNRH